VVNQAKHFCARAVQRVGVDINVIDVVGESSQAETGGELVGKVIGLELETQP